MAFNLRLDEVIREYGKASVSLNIPAGEIQAFAQGFEAATKLFCGLNLNEDCFCGKCADPDLEQVAKPEKQAEDVKGINEIASEYGIDLSNIRQSQAEFDVLTRKPFTEDQEPEALCAGKENN